MTRNAGQLVNYIDHGPTRIGRYSQLTRCQVNHPQMMTNHQPMEICSNEVACCSLYSVVFLQNDREFQNDKDAVENALSHYSV